MLTLDNIISAVKRHLGIKRVSLLDVPCGDMTWMKRFLIAREDVDYTGLDIVPELIAAHKRDFAARAAWTFEHRDILKDGLPAGKSFHLILCRSVLARNGYVSSIVHSVTYGRLNIETFSKTDCPSG